MNSSSASLDQSFVPGPVLLLGAPGVGKGTQAQILMQRWNVPQVSTGDLIRENIRTRTVIGLRFQEMVASGTYVPDEVVNQMVADRTAQADCQRGFILDGYPRTVGQANWLDAYLADELGSTHSLHQVVKSGAGASAISFLQPLVAVSINVRYDELLRRITGRRTGPVSKRIYNIYTNPPASPGVCDVDGEPLVQRPDDTEAVFRERMRVFDEQTAPVIEHYRHERRFEEVDGEQTVDAVTKDIIAALRRLRARSKRAA